MKKITIRDVAILNTENGRKVKYKNEYYTLHINFDGVASFFIKNKRIIIDDFIF